MNFDIFSRTGEKVYYMVKYKVLKSKIYGPGKINGPGMKIYDPDEKYTIFHWKCTVFFWKYRVRCGKYTVIIGPYILRYGTVFFQRKDRIFSKFGGRIFSQTLYFSSKDRIFFAKRPYSFSFRTVYFQSGPYIFKNRVFYCIRVSFEYTSH